MGKTDRRPSLAASAVAGLLWTAVSPRVTFLYLAAWGPAALVLFARVRPTRPQSDDAACSVSD